MDADLLGWLALTVGVAISLALVRHRVGWRAALVVPCALLGGVLGSRICGALAFELRPFQLREIFTLNYPRATSVLGAIIGGTAAGLGACRVLRVSTLATLGSIAPAVALAQAIGRVHCFTMGCCFGRPTSLPWGTRFASRSWSSFAIGPVPLHPTQLYEALADAVLAVGLFRHWRNSQDGCTIGWYFLGYGLVRFCVEFLRADGRVWILQLSLPQWIAIAFVAGGGLVACRLQHNTTGATGP